MFYDNFSDLDRILTQLLSERLKSERLTIRSTAASNAKPEAKSEAKPAPKKNPVLGVEVEQEDKLTIRFLVPGVEKENISVKTAGNILRVFIKSSTDEEAQKVAEWDLDRLKNDKEKAVVFPPSISLKLGVLTIEFPYKAAIEEQEYEIKAE